MSLNQLPGIANPQNTKEVRTFFNDGLQIRRNA